MAFRHVVLFRVHDGVSDDIVTRAVETLEDLSMAPGVVAMRVERSLDGRKGRVLIDVTRDLANVYPSSANKSDEGASATEFTVDVRPDSTDSLYDRLTLAPGSSPVVSPDVIRIGTTP